MDKNVQRYLDKERSDMSLLMASDGLEKVRQGADLAKAGDLGGAAANFAEAADLFASCARVLLSSKGRQ